MGRKKKGKRALHGLRAHTARPGARHHQTISLAEVQAIRERRARRTATAKHTAEIEAALEILRDLDALEARAAAVGYAKAAA
jgi:hypothetical protein